MLIASIQRGVGAGMIETTARTARICADSRTGQPGKVACFFISGANSVEVESGPALNKLGIIRAETIDTF